MKYDIDYFIYVPLCSYYSWPKLLQKSSCGWQRCDSPSNSSSPRTAPRLSTPTSPTTIRGDYHEWWDWTALLHTDGHHWGWWSHETVLWYAETFFINLSRNTGGFLIIKGWFPKGLGMHTMWQCTELCLWAWELFSCKIKICSPSKAKWNRCLPDCLLPWYNVIEYYAMNL